MNSRCKYHGNGVSIEMILLTEDFTAEMAESYIRRIFKSVQEKCNPPLCFATLSWVVYQDRVIVKTILRNK